MKKGFTLIEIIISIAIILTVTAFGLIKGADYNKTKNKLDVSLCKSMILALINDGKEYCRRMDSGGYLYFDLSLQTVNFYCQGRKVDRFYIPKGVRIYSINSSYNKINIDRNGFTADACTITLKDNNNLLNTITICVGTGYAKIQ